VEKGERTSNTNGFKERIVTYQGKILDGRHRARPLKKKFRRQSPSWFNVARHCARIKDPPFVLILFAWGDRIPCRRFRGTSQHQK